MPRLLASYPPSWILAMGTSADAGQAELLFDLLENDGAARITLGPLDLAAQDRAVTELAPSAPQAAAEPATGALALTLPSDPGRPARTAAAVRALTAAGRWDDAETLVRWALAVPLPAREARRCGARWRRCWPRPGGPRRR